MRSRPIPNSRKYPYVTRSIIDLFNSGQLDSVVDIWVDPDYGYFVQMKYRNGARRVTFGNDLGLNTGSSEDIAKDKGHTKKLLRANGISCPRGSEFILPWWDAEMARARAFGSAMVDSSSMDAFVAGVCAYVNETLNYPIYAKPINGSKGNLIRKVANDGELAETLQIYEQERIRLALVEETIGMPDYRLVVLDGELISAYERIPLTVVGDGQSTIHDLLEARITGWVDAGRDTHPDKVRQRVEEELYQMGMSFSSKVPQGDSLRLLPVSNLSLGGDSTDVTMHVHRRWVDLAIKAADVMGLRLAGVDLACGDITGGTGEYSVFEVNASPGLDHYASSGYEQEHLVQSLYRRVLNKP